MLTERPIHADLKAALINNVPFKYGHLIKFERPSRPDANGRVSTAKQRYTYLTDGSINVTFDDGSTDSNLVANGPQEYLANKVLKVGNVSEQTEARANTYNLVLDGNGIGAYSSFTGTISAVDASTWDISYPTFVDLLLEGFREGDKIQLTGVTVGKFNIVNFRANNVIRVSKIDTNAVTGTGTINMSLASEEIKSILLDKNGADYASFINREVFIYRAYFNSESAIIGAPVLLFKGIISNVAFDDADKGIQVTWGLTSHWGDFAEVRGRVTSDEFHRALDSTGTPQPASALKTAYAYDKGFAHAETSINILATYSVQVEKQDVKAKNGFLGTGIGSKVKVKKYFVSEDRNTELDFQLQSKSIPVIYGVRNVKGIPIFADTKNNNSAEVYVIHALSEGEIGGIYDTYINGNSLICNDKADLDARSVQTPDNTVQLVCRGRADRGDVLGGQTSIGSTVTNFYSGDEYLLEALPYNYTSTTGYYNYVPPTTLAAVDNVGAGIVDGESIILQDPQEITIDFFSGKPGQKAAPALIEIAAANGFKIQNSYWLGTDTAEYWGPNHRLLDTAYVVSKYKIEEGETSIPDLEFIIKGKAIECYNYDYSYAEYVRSIGQQNASLFPLGSTVSLYNDNGGGLLNSNVQIIDKWTFTTPDGVLNTRFRFSEVPNLGYVNGIPTAKRFFMKNANNDVWQFATFDFVEASGTIPAQPAIVSSNATTVNGNIAFNFSSYDFRGGETVDYGIPLFSLVNEDLSIFSGRGLFGTDRIIPVTNRTDVRLTTQIPATARAISEANAATAASSRLVPRNTIVLNTAASSEDGRYTNFLIRLKKYDPVTDKTSIQEKIITGYSGASRTVTISDVWDADKLPVAGDIYEIVPRYGDKRTSINPAIQLLDYVTSTTYGRGLNPFKDLNLPSWLEAARVCDTQSDITVKQASGAPVPAAGQVYKLTTDGTLTGTLIWQGKVKATYNGFVEFTDNIGKLTNYWNSWKSYKLNEYVYNGSRLYKVTSAGIKATEPIHTSGTTNGLQYISTGIPLISSTGSTFSTVSDGNPIRGDKNGVSIPGYSLYDSDEVNYWRYLGWDEYSQRCVTKHQTNIALDTSVPLFDNINSMLEHFGGILRYSGGQYFLDVEEMSDSISTAATEVRNITADNIIGRIKLSDDGIRSAYNSLTAAYADPANKFEARNISFFNSEYLKSDRNVPKKGNISIPGITNYYNTRILADKYLNKSRYGLVINFNMEPRGLLLLAGSVIQIQYPRYNWINKKFRISNITHQEDTTVDIVAEEYDDSLYSLSRLSRPPTSGAVGMANFSTPIAPTGLTATNTDTGNEEYSGIKLTWTNNLSLSNVKNGFTELYSSSSPNLYITATQIAGNQIITSTIHGLVVGEMVTFLNTGINEIIAGNSYFVKSITNGDQFTISDVKDGPTKVLTNTSGLTIQIQTASLIVSLPIPTNTYTDVFSNINGRVTKYYWARHKVINT